jgi:hypothetical protein
MGTEWRLCVQEHCKILLIRFASLMNSPCAQMSLNSFTLPFADIALDLTLLLQSKETFRAIIRSDVGVVVPFSTLHNRNQIYKKLTGRKLANAQLNLEKYDPNPFFNCVEFHFLLQVFETFFFLRVLKCNNSKRNSA